MSTSLFVGLALAVAAPAPKKADDDVSAKVDGNWVVESVEGPKEGPPPGVLQFQFVDGKIHVIEGTKKDESAGYTIDTTKKPFAMDIRPERGAKEKVVYAIVEVKGDTLKLCFGKDAAERPTEFKGNAEKGVMLFIMKRVKADK
ncbi:MAG TPA: TIGR03067 domain-containing protein [Gemmataceae bacterium]|jgi:uncharacterized protein (TIGR03067 family)|nr:TIGR03067 domain-containing protein [Gemmataceae bacterium]